MKHFNFRASTWMRALEKAIKVRISRKLCVDITQAAVWQLYVCFPGCRALTYTHRENYPPRTGMARPGFTRAVAAGEGWASPVCVCVCSTRSSIYLGQRLAAPAKCAPLINQRFCTSPTFAYRIARVILSAKDALLSFDASNVPFGWYEAH